jgi:hypothetical protein
LSDGEHELPAGYTGTSDFHRRDLGEVEWSTGVSGCGSRGSGKMLFSELDSRVGDDTDTGTSNQTTDSEKRR